MSDVSETTLARDITVCDCFPRLREVTAAREARYRDDPAQPAPHGPQSTVEVQVTSIGDLDEEAQSLKSGQTWVISEPEHVGGLADAPTPLEYLLSGAVGCFAAVFAFYAAKHHVDYRSFRARAHAAFDVRGHMMADAPPSGFSSVAIAVEVDSTASVERLEEILELALDGCPGIATLREPVAVDSTITVRDPANTKDSS